MNSVSLYFSSGDFVDVLRRYDEGRDQVYHTHNEVARLYYDLRAAQYRVNIYSFCTPERREERLTGGSRVVSLGAKHYLEKGLLRAAVAQDEVDAIVANFPTLELLRAAIATRSRVFPVHASSYNRTGLRSMLWKRRLASQLNNPRFELVANHCLPSTEQLARMGVNREKLIAWDVPHPSDPASREPKPLQPHRPFELVYAGSIVEAKGVPELVRAIASLRRQHFEVRCSLAGGGDVEKMQSLARSLGVSDSLSFVGVVANAQVLNMMAAADLVVVPSRVAFPEGFPLAMFEAIASRTPIVCSDHPMFREVMIDGRNASVFSSGDHRSLAAAIRRALTDPTLYATLSANAPLTWAALQGPADWRTMIFKWVVEGRDSPWISAHMLKATTAIGAPGRDSRRRVRLWADRFGRRGDAALDG